MALRHKIDSNETSAYYAEEESLGVLPVTPEWKPLEPNSYDDFGGELTLLARNPINQSRQRKKGVITDLDASGGFNQDFTQTNFQDLLQGVMFADHRNKQTENPSAVTATGYTVADETLYQVGGLIYATGFSAAANNGMKVITGLAAGEIQCAGLVVDAAPASGAKIVVVGQQGAAGDIDVDTSGDLPKLVTGTLDFTTMGLIPGEWIFIGGDGAGMAFTNAENNGYKRIKSVSATEIVIGQSTTTMVSEASAAETIQLFFGRVLKNELGSLIKRRSYNVERQLGAPETTTPNNVQAEYLVGAIPNEFTLNISQADKINADISFVATDNEQRTAVEGVKSGTRIPLVESDAFNTSSDFSSIKMFIYDPTNENANPLFAFLTELTITINNNVTPNKAVAVLGAFDVTAGTFEVSGSTTAYFSTIEAVRAVRRNENVSLFAAVAKNNAGFILDLPLVGLGNGRLNVEQDEPITLPLSMDAATAVALDPNMDYTALWVFFDYLPELAMPI